MKLMATEITRFRRKYKKAMENEPADQLLWPAIKHFLYSERDEDSGIEVETLGAYVDILGTLKIIEEDEFATSDDWVNLLKAAYIDAPKVFVKGVPSAEMAKKMAADETARTGLQAKDLGEEKLKELATKLEANVATNEEPPPEELLSSLPVPSASNLPEIKVEALHDDTSGGGDLRGDASTSLRTHLTNSREGNEPNVPITWLNVNTVFVKLTAFCDTSKMTPYLRHCLPLYYELAFKLPTETMSSSEVIEALQADTIGSGCYGSGVSGALGTEYVDERGEAKR